MTHVNKLLSNITDYVKQAEDNIIKEKDFEQSPSNIVQALVEHAICSLNMTDDVDSDYLNWLYMTTNNYLVTKTCVRPVYKYYYEAIVNEMHKLKNFVITENNSVQLKTGEV